MNRVIIQETTVTGRANFWTLFNEIRAGCGIEEGNTPIVYRYFERMAYRADIERIIGRRFSLTIPEPPVVEELVSITSHYTVIHSNAQTEIDLPDNDELEIFTKDRFENTRLFNFLHFFN